MEEQIKPDEQDVEAHKKGKTKLRGDEGTESGSEDFELHRKSMKATDEGGSDDDDVELHKKFSKK